MSAKIKNHLKSIKATVLHATSEKDLEQFIPEFVSITWMKEFSDIEDFMKSRDLTRKDIVAETFSRRTLPTALETIRLTLSLEGLDMTNVTHILRHRTFSISSQSTDHHDSMKDLNILVGDEWQGDLRSRAIYITKQLDVLYKEALEEGMSYYAARDFAPRAKETKLCVSASIKDLIAFVNQRASEQCQPTSDSILAMWVRKCILETYPTYASILEKQMPVDPVEHIYINAITHKFNLNTFPPLPHHKKILDERNVDLTGIKFGHDKCKTEYHAYDEYKALKTSLGNTKKKKVYIASGWFNPEQLQALEHVEHFMKTQSKYDFFAPRLDNKGEEGSNWDNVIQRNYDELDTCDYMIASTVGKDMGTLVEVGAFIEKGKPVIFYAPGLEGPFNLMLAKAASRVCTTPAELQDAIKDLDVSIKYEGGIE